jgi:hypothetical protein
MRMTTLFYFLIDDANLRIVYLQELPEGRTHDSEREPGWRPQLLPQLLLRTPAAQVTRISTSVSHLRLDPNQEGENNPRKY